MWMRPCQWVGTMAEPIHHAGPEVLDQHVRLVQQTFEKLAVARRLEVERNALFSPVKAHEVRRLVVNERTPRTRIVSCAHTLHLDAPYPHVTKPPRPRRP